MAQPKKGAPGALETVRAFVNTLDVESGRDQLDDPGKLETWLREHGLLEEEDQANGGGVRRALALREALRVLLLVNAGQEVSPEALSTLNGTAERARLGLQFAEDGSARLEPGTGGLDGALGRLLAIASAAMADGSWSRLKACRADTCRWAFYDQTRNRSGVWCDMAVCGNRTKVRTYRRRHGSDARP